MTSPLQGSTIICVVRLQLIAVIASLLAAVGLVAAPVSPAYAQTDPGVILATQFFGSLTGQVQDYPLSADAVLHAPSGDYRGSTGLGEFRADLEASFANLQFSTHSAAQAGELVIVAFTLTGINTGAYQGLDANCASIAVPGVAMLQVHDGIVVAQWLSYDTTLIASQIAAFNALDVSVRPGCDTQGGPQSDPTATVPQTPDKPHRVSPY